MSDQSTLFDYAAAQQLQAEGIKRAQEGMSLSTLDQAEAALKRVLERRRPFTTDDVVREVGEDEYRAWGKAFFLGGLLKSYSQRGLIRAIGTKPSEMKSNHGRPKQIWLPVSQESTHE